MGGAEDFAASSADSAEAEEQLADLSPQLPSSGCRAFEGGLGLGYCAGFSTGSPTFAFILFKFFRHRHRTREVAMRRDAIRVREDDGVRRVLSISADRWRQCGNSPWCWAQVCAAGADAPGPEGGAPGGPERRRPELPELQRHL